MALVPQTLQAELELLADEMIRFTDPAAAKAHHARRLAEIITTYIKTATVTVSTTGTAAAQMGTGNIT